MSANLENSAVATGLKKVSFHSNPKKGNAKECSNYCTIALISHASNVMLKILQGTSTGCEPRTSDAQAGFRQGRGIRDQIGNNRRIIEKSRELQKNTYFCLIYYVKAFVWITATVENSSRDGNTKPH